LVAAVTGVLVTLAGCGLPGTATLTFDGALVGRVDGPSVSCPAPGEESDAYATWRWRGDLAGRPVTVTVSALSAATQPDVLMIESNGQRWAATAGGGTLNARVDADGALHVEAKATAFATPTFGTVALRGSMRCPKK
jgi:hypothetical protein